MIDPEFEAFEDFILDGGFDIIFLDDEIQCPNCGRIIEDGEQVEWINKEEGIFKCPSCNTHIEVD